MKQKTIALALSTGGARGLGHIGVIEELTVQGYKISSISGCSIGALIGAAYASGNLDGCKKYLLELNRLRMLSLIDLSFSSKGFIKGNRIMKAMKKIIPDINIENLPIPLTIIATDIINHKEVIFEKGSLHNAIRASISLPMLFQPFEVDGMILIDGGLVNPLPVNRVKRIKNDLLVAVIASGDESLDIRQSNVKYKFNKYNLLTESVTTLIQKQIQDILKDYNPDIIISIPNKKYGILDFFNAYEMIEKGRAITQKNIINYNTSLNIS